MSAWQVWAILGVILCILEIFTAGFYLMAIGIGCFLAALVALVFGINSQIIVFVIGSIAAFFLSKKVIYSKKAAEKFGTEHLVGQTGQAVGEITVDQGHVKVGGEMWPARVDGDEVIADTTHVEIYAFEGNRLKVRKK